MDRELAKCFLYVLSHNLLYEDKAWFVVLPAYEYLYREDEDSDSDDEDFIIILDWHEINSSNATQVDKFLKELQRYWDKYDIKQRIEHATSTEWDTPTLRMIVNKIDADITTAMLKAEKRVRKSERPPWSPALKQASLTEFLFDINAQVNLA